MLAFLAIAGWTLVGLGAFRFWSMWREENRPDRIFGLLYHRVVPRDLYDTFTGTEQIFSMPEDRFAEHLAWLKANDFSFITLGQLEFHLKEGQELPPKAVWISFDDGCESVCKHALPILQRLDIPAIVYVTIDEEAWIFHEGEYSERRLSIEEIRACAAGGIEIGSHAVSHRGLNEMGSEEVVTELVTSRETLSEWSETSVRHFAVPLNFYNQTTLRQCRDAGYRTVATSDNGTSNPTTSPYRIKRFIVEGSYDLTAFKRSLEPRTIVQRRILNAIKKLPPKILGERIWMPLRELLFRSVLGQWLTFRHLRLVLLGCIALAALTLITITALAFGT